MKSKVKSRSHPQYVSGGSGHMVGKTGASPQKPGTTSGSSHGAMSKGYAKGGNHHMVGKQTSKRAKPI